MTEQDKDVLIACLIAGFGFSVTLTGTAWAVVGLRNLFRRKQGDPS